MSTKHYLAFLVGLIPLSVSTFIHFFTPALLPQFSGRRLTLFYGIMYVLSGIELRGDGGTNGSLESRWVETDGALLRTDRKA